LRKDKIGTTPYVVDYKSVLELGLGGARRGGVQSVAVFRVEPLDAIGANAMGKVGVGMLLNIGLHLLPVAVVVADLFAAGTNREQPAQRFDGCQGIGQFLDQFQAFLFLTFAPGDIPTDG